MSMTQEKVGWYYKELPFLRELADSRQVSSVHVSIAENALLDVTGYYYFFFSRKGRSLCHSKHSGQSLGDLVIPYFSAIEDMELFYAIRVVVLANDSKHDLGSGSWFTRFLDHLWRRYLCVHIEVYKPPKQAYNYLTSSLTDWAKQVRQYQQRSVQKEICGE